MRVFLRKLIEVKISDMAGIEQGRSSHVAG